MFNILKYTESKQEKLYIIAVGAIIGALAFIIIYGLSPLNPLNENFVISGYLEKDIAQHYAGWQLFRNSPWQFPLGVGKYMEYPYGGAVSYSDSIPLFAIFFKTLSPFLPSAFQYFGLFIFLCFILQGIFACLLMNLFTENKAYIFLGGSFFVFSNIMIERAFRHCALTAHFLIIAALYYYFKNRNINGTKKYLPFFIVNCIAITIHPYFLPFTFAVLFAFALENFFSKKQFLTSIIAVFFSIITTIFVGYCIGAFYVNGSMGELGYGYFNMNLNSYFNPVSKLGASWSKILQQRPFLNGQTEGFNYLGFGIIILLALGVLLLLIKDRASALNFAKKYYGIIFSAFCLTIFAIGETVSYGGLKIFTFPLPKTIYRIFSIFRANGRFGNMLFYLFIIFALYSLQKFFKEKTAFIILCIVFAVQIYDISGVLIYKHNYFYNFSAENPQYCQQVATNAFWDDALQICDGVLEMESEQGSMFNSGMIDIASKCGKYNKFINSTFMARTSTVSRMKFVLNEKAQILQGNVNNYLYIVEETKIFDPLIKSGVCQAFEVDGQLVVVKTAFSQADIEKYKSLGKFKQILL